MKEEYKIMAVSENMNAFGLYGHVLLSRDGKAFQVGANHINKRKEGDIILLDSKNPNFAKFGFEIPKELDNAPPAVLKEIWG